MDKEDAEKLAWLIKKIDKEYVISIEYKDDDAWLVIE